MIVEYIHYKLAPERREEFEQAYARAEKALAASSHCLAWELSHGIEDPGHYALRIEWDSLEGHEQGFRTSTEFRDFFVEIKPFVDAIEEMQHYELTGVAGR